MSGRSSDMQRLPPGGGDGGIDAMGEDDAHNNGGGGAAAAAGANNTGANGGSANGGNEDADATMATNMQDDNMEEEDDDDEPPPEAAAAAEKRAAIRALLADRTLGDLERRLRIQQLMDGSTKPSGRAGVGGVGVGGGGVGVGVGGVGRGSLFPGAAIGTLPSSSSSGLGSFAQGSAAHAQGATMSSAHGSAPAACVHYERKCHLVAPCCKQIYGCRVCHDEMSPACGPMDRFNVEEVVCKECGERQGCKTNACRKCGVAFAAYHCPKCNMWMAATKHPFHCDQCGFCRVGGRSNFRHCATCCMCVAASVYDTHSCMADKYKNNCPVCREDMFSSRQSPQDLPCGHAIHAHCFRNLAGFDYRCPICKKTVVSRTSMSAAWRARARDIEMQPMPPDLAREVDIVCNDCERKSEKRGWHFLGVQCPHCSSFNTVVESMGAAANDGGGAGGGAAAGAAGGNGGTEGDAAMGT